MIDPTDKEQLQHYYEHDLPEELRGVLTQLNNLIGQDKNGEIFDAYMNWLVHLSNPQILQEYALKRAEAGIDPNDDEEVWVTELPNYGFMSVEEFLSIAVLGLRLIYHVDYNSSLVEGNPAAGHLLIKNSQALLDNLDVEHLPQYTVHGSEVFWQGEFDQAAVSTYWKMGEGDMAQALLRSELDALREKERTAGEQLTPGERSTQAVLQYRLGKADGNLGESAQGVRTEVSNSKYQFNRDRVLDLALGTFKSVVNPDVEASFLSRLKALKEIVLAVGYAAIRDPRETYQYFQRQRSKVT